jgi:hypothetical protein
MLKRYGFRTNTQASIFSIVTCALSSDLMVVPGSADMAGGVRRPGDPVHAGAVVVQSAQALVGAIS